MATTGTNSPAPSPSPSPVSSFRPFSPENVKPNPHPYAIRTTSTGILSRSNSTTRKDDGRNHYIPPPSPSKEQSGNGGNGGGSGFTLWEGETKKMHGRPGHRYSRSLTGADSPSPIPLPTDKDGSIVFPPRSSSPTKDSHSMNSTFKFPQSVSTPNLVNADGQNATTASPALGRPLPLPPSTPQPPLIPPELPTNPKEWTPSQLAIYLTGSLRVRRSSTGTTEGMMGSEGQSIPAPLAMDIAEFIRKKGVTGRAFIRFTENDLEELQLNPLWRATLLEASQRLRRGVLQGRIWGFGSSSSPSPSSSPASSVPPSPAKSDRQLPENETTPRRQSQLGQDPPYPREPSPTPSDGSSSSVSSSSSSSSLRRGRRMVSVRYSNGKVKGMVESFEREQSLTRDGASTAPTSTFPSPSASFTSPSPQTAPPPSTSPNSNAVPPFVPPATPPLPFSRPSSPIKSDRPLPTPPRPLPETPSPTPASASASLEEYDGVYIFGGTARPSKGSTRSTSSKYSSIRGSRNGTGPRRRPLGSDLFSQGGGPTMTAKGVRTASMVSVSSYTVEEPPSMKNRKSGAGVGVGLAAEEEPSIEELLEQEDAHATGNPTTERKGQGAIAWESEKVGETMKRITNGPETDEGKVVVVKGARAWEEGDAVGLVTMKHVPALPPSSSSSTLAICAPAPADGEAQGPEDRGKEKEKVAYDSKSVTTDDEEDEGDEDEEIRRLEEQMDKTRALVEMLEQRLGEVEAQVELMESKATTNKDTDTSDTSKDASADTDTNGALVPVPTKSTQPSHSHANTASTSSSSVKNTKRGLMNALQCILWNPMRVANWTWKDVVDQQQPTTLRGIPPYMFLVSLGMCAVVLRAVMKRTTGLVGRR